MHRRMLLAMALATTQCFLPDAIAHHARGSIHSRRVAQSTKCTMAISGDRESAEKQYAEYFAIAPWEKNPQVMERFGRPTTLDLRWTIKPFDRGGVKIVAVLATQDGLEPLTGVKAGEWRRVGSVCVEGDDFSTVPLAVARQRALIEAWADESSRDYRTDAKVFKTGAGAPPIRIAWAIPPQAFQLSWPIGALNEVPPDVPVDDTIRCGFCGAQCRSVKQEKGGFRFVDNMLPK